jgi:DNA end-binding protein Ku
MAKAKAKPLGKKQPKAAGNGNGKLPTKVGDYVLKFGAVSVPVIVYTAAREEKIELHQYHAKCEGQIKQLGNFCPKCNGLGEKQGPEALDADVTLAEVRLDKGDIFKGFDAKEKIVHISEDEIEAAKPESGKVLDILEFVDADEVDPIAFDASFYLAPDTGAGDAAMNVFAMLRAAMEGDNALAVQPTAMTAWTGCFRKFLIRP